MSDHRCESPARVLDVGRKLRERRVARFEPAAQRFRAGVEHSEQRHAAPLELLPSGAGAAFDEKADALHRVIDARAEIGLRADHDLRGS